MAALTQNDAIAGLAMAEYEKGLNHLDDSASQKGSSSVDFVSDGIHDGLEFPTEEEKLTLRRVRDHIPWNAYRTSYSSCGSRGNN